MRRRVALFFGLSVVITACASAQTTPSGPLGRIDLGTKLPDGVVKGADDPTAEHERSAEVCAGERTPGVQVKVRWQTFAKGENRYIASYAVELTKPVDGVVVKLGEAAPATGAGPDPETKGPYVATANVVVTCKSDGELRNGSIAIRADGRTSK